MADGAMNGAATGPVAQVLGQSTVDAFATWRGNARPGQGVIYWCGDLASGRQGSKHLDALAGYLLHLAARGNIHLVQRRISIHEFNYIAVLPAARAAMTRRRETLPENVLTGSASGRSYSRNLP
jgi:hypothetical protein